MTEEVGLVPNKERIQLWINALESGEFPQVRHNMCIPVSLTYDDEGEPVGPLGYCCLGVAEVIAGENGCKSTQFKRGEIFHGGLWSTAAREWYGISTSAEEDFTFNGETGISLLSLNDSAGARFPQIAQLLRERFIDGAE